MTVPEITPHALSRYVERVRPGLDRAAALHDLRRLLLHHAERQERRPGWLYPSELDGAADYWLTVGTTVAFPVEDDRVITCLIPASLPPEVRRARTLHNGFRRRKRSAEKMREKSRNEKRTAKRSRKVDLDEA